MASEPKWAYNRASILNGENMVIGRIVYASILILLIEMYGTPSKMAHLKLL